MREEGWMIQAFWECAGNVSMEDIGALSPLPGLTLVAASSQP